MRSGAVTEKACLSNSMIGATLDEIQAAVFTPTCATSGCHAGANPSAGLDLSDADTSHAALVNMPSSQGTLLVAPTLPDESYLVHKIEGAQTAGQRMPLGRMPWPLPPSSSGRKPAGSVGCLMSKVGSESTDGIRHGSAPLAR